MTATATTLTLTPPATPSASMVGSLYDTAHYLTVGVFEKYGDPRVNHYHLMKTPWPTIIATLLYYWFVRSVGPKMMRDRKAYEIIPLIRVYNFMMATWNGYGFLVACSLTTYGLETVGCRPVDSFQRDERTLSQIYYGWMFFTSRLVEFADTFFFVLRKKDSQMTSFHVFHHSMVPTTTWFFLKFAPGGNSAIFPFINTAIHTIMYSYYLLATFPSMRPYLGWKKYLTQMQIIQFLIIITCCLQPLFIPGCKFPRALLLVMVMFSVVFICLFVDFYLKCYLNTSKKLQDKKPQQQQQQQFILNESDKIDLVSATTSKLNTNATTKHLLNGDRLKTQKAKEL